ncbi:uncharacterized protein LOC132746871 [Ruditapes philippinarum]|uniref:uncharacterized protein LOC132746871 n=1 Tax=Ruditapes philippinarum TaxID=129788 RepID=UPI00295C1797|nr:uncharacterized protein LOC132746871 [Ruditapes philippinarum]
MNVQTEYFARLLFVLLQCGMLICRGVTDREMAGSRLDVILKSHEQKLKKKLLRCQYVLLFPKSGTPDIKDLDLSLLTVVLLDVLSLTKMDKQYVRVIKDTRNKLSHNSTATLTETDYKTIKINLEHALTKLALGLDVTKQTECSQLIQKLTKEPLDEAAALVYVKQLRNDDELIQNFEGMLGKQSEDIEQVIKASESRIQVSLSDMEERFSTELKNIHTGYISEDFTSCKSSESFSPCDKCFQDDISKPSTFYCEDCSMFLCLKCNTNIHKVEPGHRSQRIVRGKTTQIDTKGSDVCHEHKRNLAYICESDNELCCEKCLKDNHQQCETVTTISDSIFELNFNPVMEISRLQNESLLITEWLSSVESEVNKDVDSIASRLEDLKNDLLKAFDDEKRKVTEKAELAKRNTMKQISTKRKSCEEFYDKTKKARLQLINMTKCGTTRQKVIAQYQMEKFRNTFKSLKDISVVSLKFGSFNIPDQILQQPASVPSYHVDAPETRPVRMQQISQAINKESERTILFTGLDYLPDGRLVAVDNKHKTFLVLSDGLVTLGTYAFEQYPMCIVVISEDEVAVTMGNVRRIIFLHVSQSNKISLRKTLGVKLPCFSICLKDDRHFVVGNFRTLKSACIVSLTGEEKDLKLKFPRRKFEAGFTFCTYLAYRNKLVLSQSKEDSVTIYDIGTNTSVIVKNDKIKYPKGVAAGPFDCIFVCCMYLGSIVQISPNGLVIASHTVGVIRPYNLCFSKDKATLAVFNSDKGNYSIHVFKVDVFSN